jgi:hypothetical protein
MEGFGTIATVLKSVLGVTGLFGKIKERKLGDRLRIREATSTAYHATEAYYASLEAGGPADRERAIGIAALWEKVGFLVEPYDAKLASRLALKSVHWREVEDWSAQEIKDAGIGLNEIRGQLMILLSDPVKRKKARRRKGAND